MTKNPEQSEHQIIEEELAHEASRREIARFREVGLFEQSFSLNDEEGKARLEVFEAQLNAIGTEYEIVRDARLVYVFFDQETAQRLMLTTRQKTQETLESSY